MIKKGHCKLRLESRLAMTFSCFRYAKCKLVVALSVSVDYFCHDYLSVFDGVYFKLFGVFLRESFLIDEPQSFVFVH